MKMNEYMERTEQVVLHTYNRFPVVFEKGEGVHLYDTEGKEYLDFVPELLYLHWVTTMQTMIRH